MVELTLSSVENGSLVVLSKSKHKFQSHKEYRLYPSLSIRLVVWILFALILVLTWSNQMSPLNRNNAPIGESNLNFELHPFFNPRLLKLSYYPLLFNNWHSGVVVHSVQWCLAIEISIL